MSVPSVYLVRLGCPKAEADHDGLLSELRQLGAVIADDPEDADTLILSTCAFLHAARAEAVDTILEGVDWKGAVPGRRLFVTGCMPSRYPQELVQELPEVDGFFPFAEWKQALASIVQSKKDQTPDEATHIGQLPRSLEERLFRARTLENPVFAYIRIAEGCDRRCSYCAIPSFRGPYRSRPEVGILDEADRLLELGVRELIVVAQEINSYGHDLGDGSSIERLLPKLGERAMKAGAWLRILYTHPPRVTDTFIDALAATPALVPYVDFPVEHADDSVLKAMRRGTTWAKMMHAAERMREKIPHLALRTSIIVGHPCEGEHEFRTMLKRLEEAAFERIGVFRYSPEVGTHAATLDAPHDKTAMEREAEALLLAEEIASGWYREQVGSRVEVIAEGVDEDGVRVGRTVWDAPEVDGIALIDGSLDIGRIADARITGGEPFEFRVQV
ncbi:30S ribosomal protein S12 methylthiotransferase RimO [bacterium]|nr:30S ribosomal protein S12 methylthiotransferase RimO [bacterium]